MISSLIYFLAIEQAVVLCQVEKAKEDMLNQLYSSIRLGFLHDLNLCELVITNQLKFEIFLNLIGLIFFLM